MLLFDRVQQSAWTPPANLLRDEQGHGLLVLRKMAELIRGSSVYVLDNLAPYLHERLAPWQEEEPDWREVAPAAQPLAERTWFEWSLAGVEQEPFRGWHRVGVLMRRQGAERAQEGIPSSAEHVWQPRIAVWRSQESLPIWPPTTHRAFADREGTVFGVGRIVGPNTFGDYFTYCTLAIALMAIAFTGARNVDQKVHNAAGPGAGHGEARATPYRTLHLKPTRASAADTATVDAEAYLRRHVVHGRWKVFTPERPMSGKPGLHGRYWVEPEPSAKRRVS